MFRKSFAIPATVAPADARTAIALRSAVRVISFPWNSARRPRGSSPSGARFKKRSPISRGASDNPAYEVSPRIERRRVGPVCTVTTGRVGQPVTVTSHRSADARFSRENLPIRGDSSRCNVPFNAFTASFASAPVRAPALGELAPCRTIQY